MITLTAEQAQQIEWALNGISNHPQLGAVINTGPCKEALSAIRAARAQKQEFTAEQQDKFAAAFDKAFEKAGLPQKQEPLTIEAAEKMGAKGAEPTEEERQLFEAWMKGHCWKVCGKWDGKQYVGTHEYDCLHPYVIQTRVLWAAWRDRAALSAPVNQNHIPDAAKTVQEPVDKQDSDDRRLLREIFMLCEATEEIEPTNDFMRGRVFEAKGIRRGIGTWYQDTFCGRSYMGEPVINAATVNQNHIPGSTKMVQEPVAWYGETEHQLAVSLGYKKGWKPLYAAPVRTKDLTDDEIVYLWNMATSDFDFARAVIAKFKEKNK